MQPLQPNPYAPPGTPSSFPYRLLSQLFNFEAPPLAQGSPPGRTPPAASVRQQPCKLPLQDHLPSSCAQAASTSSAMGPTALPARMRIRQARRRRSTVCCAMNGCSSTQRHTSSTNVSHLALALALALPLLHFFLSFSLTHRTLSFTRTFTGSKTSHKDTKPFHRTASAGTSLASCSNYPYSPLALGETKGGGSPSRASTIARSSGRFW